MQRIVIPRRMFENILLNNEIISDLDITEALNQLEKWGEEISHGPIEAWYFTEEGDIEVFLEEE